MHDPDILSIQRKRRREGRCLRCARAVERRAWRPSILCGICIKTLAYCPQCETLYKRRPGLESGRASEYCTTCKSAHQRSSGGHRPYARYLADQRSKRHALLPDLVRRYKRGQTLPEIGKALGLPRNRVESLIRGARQCGEWPEELRRSKKAVHHGKPKGNP